MTMKSLVAMTMGLSLLFLAACKDDTTNGNLNEAGLDEDRFLRMAFDIVTNDDRNLTVTTLGYCNTLADLELSDYKEQCPAKIAEKLNIITRVYECFEGSIPAVNGTVRNHEGLPRNDDFCYDSYPEKYAVFPEDMMRRTTALMHESDIYTVTKITPKP